MHITSITREVAAPPELTYDTFTDLSHSAERLSAIIKVEVLTDGPFAEGTRWRETRMMFGRECTEEMRVVHADRPACFRAASYSCGTNIECEFRFEPSSTGTRVTFSNTAEPVTIFARLMTVLMRPFMGRMVKSMRDAVEQDINEMSVATEKLFAEQRGAGDRS